MNHQDARLSRRVRRKKKASASMHLAHHISQVVGKANEWQYSENPVKKAAIVLCHVYIIPAALFAFLLEALENFANKHRLALLVQCPSKLVAGELNEFIRLQGAAPYYADDFHYSATIKKEWLASLRVIWGHAYFEALEDTSLLKSLYCIRGDAYFSGETFKGIEPLQIVGGDVYWNGKKYSLEQFKQLQQKLIARGQYLK